MRHRRSAVKRAHAERYLLLTLVFLAGSVIVTRVYLELTGYPQIGGGDLHIAHLLWGGLLLYIAALLPLILLNEWALTWSAVLGGVGVGLFIDEVGKFITRTNDYFYPPAAPIIYAFFLLSVLLFLLVRRKRNRSVRGELQRAVERYQNVIDGAMDANELSEIRGYLAAAKEANAPRLVELGDLLRAYLDKYADELVVEQSGWFAQLQRRVTGWFRRIDPRTHRRWLVGLTLLNAIGVIGGVILFVVVLLEPEQAANRLIAPIVTDGEVRSMDDRLWLVVRMALDLIASMLALAALLFFMRRRDRAATRVAIYGAVFSLTTVTLLTFYLDQFGAISGALYQFLVLMVAVTYANRQPT